MIENMGLRMPSFRVSDFSIAKSQNREITKSSEVA